MMGWLKTYLRLRDHCDILICNSKDWMYVTSRHHAASV